MAVHPELPLVGVGCDNSMNVISTQPEIISFDKKDNYVVYFSNINNNLILSDIVNNTSKSFPLNFSSENPENILITLNQFQSNNLIEGFINFTKNSKNELIFFAIRISDLFYYQKKLPCKNAVFCSS